MKKLSLKALMKKQWVFFMVLILALVSCCFVLPDQKYAGYFDAQTLMCLFCIMLIITGFETIGFVEELAKSLVAKFKSQRGLLLGLVWATALCAMLVSNDVALLIFLPLTYTAFKATNHLSALANAFVMETAAANLGGMLTPFGSPQNLFLYSYFKIDPSKFFALMIIPFATSMILISILCWFREDGVIQRLQVSNSQNYKKQAILYTGLFGFAVLLVFRVFPTPIGLAIPLLVFLVNRGLFLKLDWGLFLTFVLFFVLSGNLARMGAVNEALSSLMDSHVLLWSTASSQLISNVPSAVLLAGFTDNYQELLVGVNIGGVGTPIASLASLIALAKWREYQPQKTLQFLGLFVFINFGLLFALFITMTLAFAFVL